MFSKVTITAGKTLCLLALLCSGLLFNSPAYAEERIIRGIVVDHLTRESLNKVTVGVFEEGELVQQQFINADETFEISLNYDESKSYSLTARKQDYQDTTVALSRALAEDTIPDQMKLSLSDKDSGFQFTGQISDRDTGELLPNTKVVLTNIMTGEVTETATDYQGNYNFQIDSGYEYTLLTDNRDYLQRHASINYCNDTLEGEQKYCFRGLLNVGLDSKGGISGATILMDKIEIGKRFRVDNIYYNYNETTLRPDGLPNLDRLFYILTDNPQLIVELGSHADSRGSDKYNLKLSQGRAQSAVDYVIGRGVAEKRISAKGFGEELLLNHCKNGVKCSEEEHEANRRTEFKIVAIDDTVFEPAN